MKKETNGENKSLHLTKDSFGIGKDEAPDVILPENALIDNMLLRDDRDLPVAAGSRNGHPPWSAPDESAEQFGDQPEEEADAEAAESADDPLVLYLQQIRPISLIEREREVEIVKRVEEGEKEIARVIVNTPITVNEVVRIGKRLGAGKISVREIMNGLEDDEIEIDEAYYTRKVLALSEASGGVQCVAAKARLNPTSLYRTLSARGNPELKSMRALLRAMGLRLSVEPIQRRA